MSVSFLSHLLDKASCTDHQPARSCGTCIQHLLATFLISWVHLVGGLPIMRFLVRGRHSNTSDPQRPYRLRYDGFTSYAYCPCYVYAHNFYYPHKNIKLWNCKAWKKIFEEINGVSSLSAGACVQRYETIAGQTRHVDWFTKLCAG